MEKVLPPDLPVGSVSGWSSALLLWPLASELSQKEMQQNFFEWIVLTQSLTPLPPPFSIKPTTTKTKCSGKKWSKNGILYNKRPSSLNILFSMLCICALSLCLLWPKFMHAYWYAGPLRSSLFHELVGVCPFPLLIWRKTMHIGAQAHSTPPFFTNW